MLDTWPARTGLFAIDVPVVNRRRVESRLARPFEPTNPRAVAEPVADVVLVASVDEHTYPRGELVGYHRLIVVHPISRHLEHDRDGVVAVGPLLLCAESRHHLGHMSRRDVRGEHAARMGARARGAVGRS